MTSSESLFDLYGDDPLVSEDEDVSDDSLGESQANLSNVDVEKCNNCVCQNCPEMLSPDMKRGKCCQSFAGLKAKLEEEGANSHVCIAVSKRILFKILHTKFFIDLLIFRNKVYF